MPNVSQLNGFILNARPWRESSLLLDLFSRELGYIRVAARGIKSEKRNNKSALLQCFQPLRCDVIKAHEYYYLGNVELSGKCFSLNTDAYLCGVYCNELLTRLLPEHDAHPELFDAYFIALEGFCSTPNLANILRAFECQLLDALGYAIDFSNTREGEVVSSNAYYRLYEDGVSRSVAADNHCVSGAALLAIADGDFRCYALEAKRVFRFLLLPHLGDKPLQSRQLWLARLRLNALVESSVGAEKNEPDNA